MQAAARVSAVPRIDFKELFCHLYTAPERGVEIVQVPRMAYLVCCGIDEPFSSAGFQRAEESLHRLSNNMQTAIRDSLVMDFRPMPLEILWASETAATNSTPSEPWKWLIMIMQPVTKFEIFERERLSLEQVAELRDCRALQLLRFEEGPCAQILYEGPRESEEKGRARLQQALTAQNLVPHGYPHTIYLTQPSATDEPVQAILRQPIRLPQS